MNSNDGQLHERLAKLEAQARVLKVGIVLGIGLADYMQKPPISRFIGLTGDKTVRGTP